MKNSTISNTANSAIKECQNIKQWLRASKKDNEELLRLTDEVTVLIQNIAGQNSRPSL